MVSASKHRQSIRLKDYDYAQAGAYFVTVCVQGRRCLFGQTVAGVMVLNDYGRAVAEEWSKTAELRHDVELDAFVVMPNHFHGIVVLKEDDTGTARRALREPVKSAEQ